MNKDTFYPLRSIKGKSIPIKSITILSASTALESASPDVKIVKRSSLNDTVNDVCYKQFFPDFTIGNDTLGPADGVCTLPLPPLFAQAFGNGQTYTLSCLTNAAFDAADDQSRKFSLTVELNLDVSAFSVAPLIGGICLGGYPYLPYCINS